MPYTAAVIGTGRAYAPDASHSVGYLHAEAYRSLGCSLVGACARTPEHAARFAQRYSAAHFGCDYRQVLQASRPDLVSVTTFAGSHREVIEAAVDTGTRGIWCEKPLSLTLDDAEAVERLCSETGVRIVVNHQRRYLSLFSALRRVLDDGLIGRPLLLLTVGAGWDLTEWGSHWLDMFRHLCGERHGEWVMGQISRQKVETRYGHPVESHGVAYGAFSDGTRFLMEGGRSLPGGDGAIRVVGTEGLVEAHTDGAVRVCNDRGWQPVETSSDMHWPRNRSAGTDPYTLVLSDLIAWLEGGAEPYVSVRNAVASSELYLGASESAVLGDRIDLPLRSQDRYPLERIAQVGSERSHE
jgi:UDP-N-acetylglucosamine 3-dehydrogenase